MGNIHFILMSANGSTLQADKTVTSGANKDTACVSYSFVTLFLKAVFVTRVFKSYEDSGWSPQKSVFQLVCQKEVYQREKHLGLEPLECICCLIYP